MKRNQVSIFDLRKRVFFTDATLELGGKALKSIDCETAQTRNTGRTLNRLSDLSFWT